MKEILCVLDGPKQSLLPPGKSDFLGARTKSFGIERTKERIERKTATDKNVLIASLRIGFISSPRVLRLTF